MKETRICPICSRPLTEEAEAARFQPFCSRRCADVDLGRWLKGSYAIPTVELDDETETEAAPPEQEAGPEPLTPTAGPVRPGRLRH